MGKLVSGRGQERLLRKGLSTDLDVVGLLLCSSDKCVVKGLAPSDYFKIVSPGRQLMPYARCRALTCLNLLLKGASSQTTYLSKAA